MASKKKVSVPKPSASLTSIDARMEQADKTHDFIARLAYGKEPETLNMPEELSGTPLGGSFKTPLSLPDPNDDAAKVSLANILKYKNEGVNTADSADIVRREWQTPPATASAEGGFMNLYASGLKTPTYKNVNETLQKRTTDIATRPEYSDFRKTSKLSARSTPESVVSAMVSNRQQHFSAQLMPWYEGQRTGLDKAGYPVYEQGESVTAIGTRAQAAGFGEADVRRDVAISSPKARWSLKSGGMPNIDTAIDARRLSLENPEMSHEEIGQLHKSTVKGTKILAPRAANVSQNARGELSQPHEPMVSAGEKVANFDLGLVNPHHPQHGHSAFIAHQKSQAYTGDTHDLRAAGIKTPATPVLDSAGSPVMVEKFGKQVPKTVNEGEQFLQRPGGMDILTATARMATAERFNEDYSGILNTHGEDAAYKWGRANAHKYTPNNAQAEQWVNVRGMA
jgi:hypothetical protein